MDYRRPVTMTVYERLNEIRSCALTARALERLGRDKPAVLDAVITLLTDIADLAAELPPSFVAAQPDLPWQRLGEIAAWRTLPREPLRDRAWLTLEDITPLQDAVFFVINSGWDGDPHADGRPRGWFETSDGRQDYSYASESGSLAGGAELIIPGVGTYPCSYLACAGIFIQLSNEGATALSGAAGMQLWARRLGMGRIRKDGSAPMEPPPDRIWVQRVLGEATLVSKHPAFETRYAYLRLGELSRAVKGMAAAFSRVPTLLFVSDRFLPAALKSTELDLIEARQAWGALVSTTIDG